MARLEQELSEQQFRTYITDSLYYMPQRKRLTVRYADIIKPKKIDKRSAEDIVSDVTEGAGITLK